LGEAGSLVNRIRNFFIVVEAGLVAPPLRLCAPPQPSPKGREFGSPLYGRGFLSPSGGGLRGRKSNY